MSGRCGSRRIGPLLRREPRPTRVAAALELVDQRLADLPPDLRREELAHRGAGPDHAAERLGAWALLDELPRVVLRHLVDRGGGDAEERADAVERGQRLVHQLLVAQQEHLVAGEVVEEVCDLPAVHPEPLVVPERSPPVVDALRLPADRLHDVVARLQPVHPQVHPVAVGAVDGVAEHRDQLRVRVVDGDPASRVAVVEVERRALAARHVVGGVVEEREVAVALPDPLQVAVRVARPLVRRGRAVAAQVVLRLLHRRQVEPRVAGQRRVERARAGLGGADQEEVGRTGHAPKYTDCTLLKGPTPTGMLDP